MRSTGSRHELYRMATEEAIPIEVMLELTHHCNFRCQHCYIPDFSVPDALSTERVLRLLEELAEMGTLIVTLSGGEIFLRSDWYTVAERARELGFAVSFFTNGFSLDEGVARRLEALQARVEISLYTMDEESFDHITKRKGSFRGVIRGIECLRERDVPIVLKAPVMTLNRGQIDGVRRYANEIGADFRSAVAIVAKKDGDLTPLGLRVPLEDAFGELGGPSIGCHPKDLDGPLCSAASSYGVIDSQGNVMACNILPGSDSSIRDRPFREVWESSPWLQKIRSIRREDLHTCKSCEKLSFCGRCHAMALVEDGDLYGPSTFAQNRAELIERDSLGSGRSQQ